MLKKPIPQRPITPEQARSIPTTKLRHHRVSPFPAKIVHRPAAKAHKASAMPILSLVNFGQFALPKNATPMMATTNNPATAAGCRQCSLPNKSPYEPRWNLVVDRLEAFQRSGYCKRRMTRIANDAGAEP